MSQKNHTAIDVDKFHNVHFSKKKVIADILFFSLGMLTALVFVVVFYTLVDHKTLSFLRR